jgi:two-component system, chemotaxis family, protein-glutamate methylesterase/glutaminase
MSAQNKLVVIGGSAGSLEVILRVLPLLHANLSVPIVIVMHRKNVLESLLAKLLNSRTGLNVKEAEEKESILPGNIYLAPADYHLLIEENCTFSLDDSEKINYSRPSIDVTFECASEVYGRGLACILLSGANADGVKGLQMVKKNEGIAVIQDPDSAEVSFMPLQAFRHVAVDYVLRVEEMAHFINNLGAGSVDKG